MLYSLKKPNKGLSEEKQILFEKVWKLSWPKDLVSIYAFLFRVGTSKEELQNVTIEKFNLSWELNLVSKLVALKFACWNLQVSSLVAWNLSEDSWFIATIHSGWISLLSMP